MPLSEKQLAANRANAQILRPRERFLKLLAVPTTEFLATTPNELALVETMAFCRWRVLRSRTFQASRISREERRQGDSVTDEDPPTQSVIALNTLNQPPSLLETLSRLEIRFDRQYHRAADHLARLKREKNETIPGIQ